MVLRYFAVFLLISITTANPCRSQTVEQNIFAETSKALCKANENWNLKKELKGLNLLEDVDGNQILRFANKSGPNDSTAFKKYGFKRCVEILSSSDLKIFPLRDTVEIVDTNRLFSELDFRCDSIFLGRFHETNFNRQNKSRLFIYKAGFVGDILYVCLCSSNSDQILDFSFTMTASNIKLKRFTFHSKKEEKERSME